jgi:hemerythrin-like domain-containing protein
VGSDTVSGDALATFEREHREALAALRRLEAAALALEAGAAPEPHLETVREAYTILTTVVRAHNENEEAALFPLLEDLAPSPVFVKEHGELRALEERLARALDGPGPEQAVIPVALAIVELLRFHIAREDEVLFPMARALLGPDGLAEVARRLGHRAEHGRSR